MEQFGASDSNENRSSDTERISIDLILQQVSSQQQADGSFEDEPAEEPAEKLTLKQISFLVSGEPDDGLLSEETKEINDVLEYFLLQPVPSCLFKHFDGKICDILPDDEQAVMSDFLVAEEHFYNNLQTYDKFKNAFANSAGECIKHPEYSYILPLFRYIRSMADKDEMFRKFLDIDTEALIKFLSSRDDDCQHIPPIHWGSGSNKVRACTLAQMLERLNCFKGWDPCGESLKKYEENVYKSSRALQSVVCAINAGYYPDIEDRVASFKN